MFYRCIIICFLLGCQPPPIVVSKQPPANALTQPTIPVSTMEPVSLPWESMPTTRVAVGQSIWLETVKSPDAALSSTLTEALALVGGSCSPSHPFVASLPRQPAVTWQKRSKGVDRRVVVDLEVVLRKGFLEHLFSRAEAAKDHESLLSAPFDAEILHAAVLGSGLQPGKPARFINEKREYDFKPATGDVVRIFFEYVNDAGKTIVAPAQTWVVRAKDAKPLDSDWVYAGSFKGKAKTGEGKEFVYFGANDGRVVCLSNFGTALLDLPFESVDADPNGDNLGYRANTELIPERGTKVRAILEGKPKAP
jgi:hypothetical protein